MIAAAYRAPHDEQQHRRIGGRYAGRDDGKDFLILAARYDQKAAPPAPGAH
jgi:hypothetical protein